MHVNSAPNIRSDGTYITKKNDLRITRIGKLIRFGFDELPQLVNILLGDMSVVGPRPDLPHQVDKFPEEYKKKYTVKPGLTSLPAISGRNNLDFEERLKLDLYYINHQTVIMDIRIILATILMPLKFAFK
jgi:lipopolysaccharide/colanic/teichoic acid biosynthesis glycosyltransferase